MKEQDRMDERKRKLNEAIVNILYPSPPQPQPQPQPSSPPPLEQQELQPTEAFIKGFASDVISGTSDDASTSGDEEEEHNFETEKLTRAQRKNIRKKKLKEEALRRAKLIGPLLPLSPTTTTDQVAEDAPPVRSNASEQGDSSMKLKRRRMAKRLAKVKRIASTFENCNPSSTSSSALHQKETHM